MTGMGQELYSGQNSLFILVLLLVLYFITPYGYLEIFLLLLRILIGFYFAIIIGHHQTAKLVDKMWIAVRGEKADSEVDFFNTSAIIGRIERPLYIIFLLLGKPEGIGVWLALKTAGRIWGEESAKKPTRTIYQIFLVGNAMSIGYAVIGWAMITAWLPERNWLYILLAVIALYCGNLLLCREVELEGSKYWIEKGRELEKERMYTGSIRCFENAIQLNPRNAIAWYKKIESLRLLGCTSEADAALDEAKKLGYIN